MQMWLWSLKIKWLCIVQMYISHWQYRQCTCTIHTHFTMYNSIFLLLYSRSFYLWPIVICKIHLLYNIILSQDGQMVLMKNISVVYTTKKYGPNITKTFVAVLHLRVINNDEHNSYWKSIKGRHGRDCMVVGFTTTCAISDLWQVGGFLRYCISFHQLNWPQRYSWSIV